MGLRCVFRMQFHHTYFQTIVVSDTYVIDFANPADELLGMMLVVRIDAQIVRIIIRKELNIEPYFLYILSYVN